jgi:uncharacterized protein Yka (UPF0111/DUF47 family)
MALNRRALLSGLAAGVALPAFRTDTYTTLPEIDIFADKMEEVLRKGLPA